MTIAETLKVVPSRHGGVLISWEENDAIWWFTTSDRTPAVPRWIKKKAKPPSEQTTRLMDTDVRTNRERGERVLRIVAAQDLIAMAIATKVRSEAQAAVDYREHIAEEMRNVLGELITDGGLDFSNAHLFTLYQSILAIR